MSIDRRAFLKLGGAGVLGVSFLSLLPGCEEFSVTPLGNDQAPFLTPEDQFFVQNGGEGSIPGWKRPSIAESDWRLKITELVTPPNPELRATVSFNDLMALRDKEITLLKTIQCVLESPLRTTTTGFMGNAYWTGIPLSAVLAAVTFRPTTKRLLFYGQDGFYNNIKLDRLTNPGLLTEPLLVYAMNGKPLSEEHGFPVRLLIQEGYGYKNVKWLTEVQATTFDLDTLGTYQKQGFADDGVMRVNSRATNVRDAVTLPAGPIAITGYAVSGTGAISNIDVSIDGGAFTPAEIIPLDKIQETESIPPTVQQLRDKLAYPFASVWTQWRFPWEAPAGAHRVAIRATDTSGQMQPAMDTNIFDGQTRIAEYQIMVA